MPASLRRTVLRSSHACDQRQVVVCLTTGRAVLRPTAQAAVLCGIWVCPSEAVRQPRFVAAAEAAMEREELIHPEALARTGAQHYVHTLGHPLLDAREQIRV